MGLHLSFELRLPSSIPHNVAGTSLQELRAFALTQPFAEVSPFLATDPALTAGTRERLDDLQFWASIIAKPYDEDDPPLVGDATTAQGFFVNPGKGCETATFGLLTRRDTTGAHSEWFWHCSCKTQYASIVSDAHLITCHTSLVRVLDHAIVLGFGVVVRDETHYWETRDETRLLQEVGAMNRIVARFAGKLSDALGPEHETRAAIFEHRRFERLEMGEKE